MNTPPTIGNKTTLSFISSQTNGLYTSKSSDDYQYLDGELINRDLIVKQGILHKRGGDKASSNAVEFYFVLE